MGDIQLSSMMMALIGATVVSFIAIFALGWFVNFQQQRHKWSLALIFPAIIFAMGMSSILTNRSVTAAEFELKAAAGTESELLTWFLRGVTGFILALCLARLISVSQKFEFRNKDGKPLYLAFVFFFVTNEVLNNVFGFRPLFDQKTLYPLLIFTTFYFSRNKDKSYSIDATKVGMLFFFGACCLTAVIAPQIAVQHNYAGWIPGLNIRLWGIGSNPNSIGPLSVMFLMLLWNRPFTNRLLQYVAVGIGLAVLILAQSKTAWICTAIGFPILIWGHIAYAPVKPGHRRRQIFGPLSGPILTCLLGLTMVTLAAIYYFYGFGTHLSQDEEVATLTGRTYIWQIALETWSNNPLFGYGGTMWNNDFRQSIGMEFAYHAHNQFLQAMSVAGTVGLIGLVIYVIVLCSYALTANRETRGLSLALFAIFIIRTFTETPFDLSTLFTGEFIMQLLLFRLLLQQGRQRQEVAYRQPVSDLSWGRP